MPLDSPDETVLSPQPLVAVALHLYLLQGAAFLVPLLALPFLFRTLGPEAYGSLVLAQAFVGYATIATDYGFPLTAARDISVARGNPMMVAKIFWTTMCVKVLFLAGSGAVLGLVIAVVPTFHEKWRLVVACSTSVIGSVLFPLWYLQGKEKLRLAAAMQLVARCVSTLGVFTLVRSSDDVILAAFLISAPPLFSYAVGRALRMFPAVTSIYIPKPREIRDCIVAGWHVFIGTVSTTLYLQTNTFALGMLSDSAAVGFFGVGYNVTLAVQGLAIPAIQSVYPRVSFLFKEDPPQAWRMIKTLSMIVLPGIGIASLALAIFAGPLVQLVAGTSYAGAISVVRIMSALPLMITLAGILGPTVMMNINLSRSLMRIYIGVGLLNILILPYLVLSYAADGAAISLLVAETVGPIAMLSVIRKHCNANGKA